jgi:SAM-dependent methyltransferase
MTAEQYRRDFDRIAPVYDLTRADLEPSVLEGILSRVKTASSPRVLEVGVGTGRVAVRFVKGGCAVAGVDSSRPMISRAASKGLTHLVRADAGSLPFSNGSFDFVLFVHVLNLLRDPMAATIEARRVSRTAVFALREEFTRLDSDGVDKEAVRSAVRDELVAMGFSGPPRPAPGGLEDTLLRKSPPIRGVEISDVEESESPADRLDMIRLGADRTLLGIPDPIRLEAVRRAEARLARTPTRSRRRLFLLEWPPLDRP